MGTAYIRSPDCRGHREARHFGLVRTAVGEHLDIDDPRHAPKVTFESSCIDSSSKSDTRDNRFSRRLSHYTASSIHLGPVISRRICEVPSLSPCLFRMGERVRDTQISRPSLHRCMVSIVPNALIGSSPLRSGEKNRIAGRPMISHAVYPSSTSAPLFQLVIMPCRFSLMMASLVPPQLLPTSLVPLQPAQ